jgi:DNA-binding CsgD family transcriptional regulator
MTKTIDLTPVDWLILCALNQGASNRAIATALCKSEFTIRNQLSKLYKAIQVTNRTHAAFWYREHVAKEPTNETPAFIERRKGPSTDRRKAVRTSTQPASNLIQSGAEVGSGLLALTILSKSDK